MTEYVLSDIVGGFGVLTLNREKALHALTLEMVEKMDQVLSDWEKDPAIQAVIIKSQGSRAFCAGGDIKSIGVASKKMRAGQGDGQICRDMFRVEYALNTRIHNFKKPYISLVDGIVMGGGVGISVHGKYKVITENTLFSMPETGIGFFPDVGSSRLLNNCQGKVGLYLALTGRFIKPADCFYIGYATHYIASADVGLLFDALVQGDVKDIDTVLSTNCSDLEEGDTLRAQLDLIDRHFDQSSVEDIFKSLEQDINPWAQETLEVLKQRSPTSLKVTYAQMKKSENLTFEGNMAMEYCLAQSFTRHPDLYEGIRAVLIDKDKAPKWCPSKLEDVPDADVSNFFAEFTR